MPKGHCILIISTIGAFYSKLYNLSEHPNYSELYEPWSNNNEKLYNHKMELEYQKNSDYQLLVDTGLYFAKPIANPKIESVDKNELKGLLKTGIIQFENFKITN